MILNELHVWDGFLYLHVHESVIAIVNAKLTCYKLCRDNYRTLF